MPWRKSLPWLPYALTLISPLLLHTLALFFSTSLLKALHAVNADLYGIALGAVLVLGPAYKMIRNDNKNGVGIPGENKKKIWLFALLGGVLFSAAVGGLMEIAGFRRLFSNIIQERLFFLSFVSQLLFWGLLIPVAEEMIHRGLVYPRLRSHFRLWSAVLISSVIFAVGHGNMIQIIYAFCAGIVLCLLREHGGLESAMAFHAGANLISVILHRLM